MIHAAVNMDGKFTPKITEWSLFNDTKSHDFTYILGVILTSHCIHIPHTGVVPLGRGTNNGK